MIKIVQKASVQLSITLILKQHVFAIRIVSKVQFVILIFKMLSHVMEMAGVNKLGCINMCVNVVKVTTLKSNNSQYLKTVKRGEEGSKFA